MGDYPLTAGQQQQLTNFLNAGKSIYLEGNDFGYFQKTTNFYKMFGATYMGDGSSSNNVATLSGQRDTLMDGSLMGYPKGTQYPDQYVDYINPNGGDLLFKCQTSRGRGVCYAGPDGTYRTVYLTFWFGAMKNASSTHTKAELMAAIMRYLKGDSLVVTLEDEIPASTGIQIPMFLENPVSEGNRPYGVFGSVTGTSPGIPVNGSVTLPLNFDPFFMLVTSMWNTPAFSNFLGNLDATGRSIATFDTLAPLDPGLVGLTFYFAYLLRSPYDFASNAVEIPVVP
jgi:hypothetical protein